MASDYLKNLIHKYLENSCSEEETGIVLNYLETPEGQSYLATLIEHDIADADHLLQASKPAVGDHILYAIQQKMEPKAGKSRRMQSWYWVAASVVVLLLAFAFYQFWMSKPIVYQTAYGETKTIILSDSTVITLNANSRLSYQPNYHEQREVWLKGEAFFEVKHVEEQMADLGAVKFIVYVNDLAVEVTGTSFNVKNRNKKTQVVLNTGKVQLKAKNQHSKQQKLLSMHPGEVVEVLDDNIEIVKKAVDPVVYSSWKDKKLVCNETPLREVVPVIQDTYGKKVVFDDPALAQKEITGTLPTDNLHLLLEVLAASLQLDIQQQTDIILIKETINKH